MKPLCVIPARRGSKRLPLKNIAPLGGRPMLAYTVDAALASDCFDDVYVSTEDEEIAEIARGLGAIAHERPVELSGDLVSATDVCLDVAIALRSRGRAHDVLTCLQPSSPLRTAQDISHAQTHFDNSDADYLVSVTFIDPHYFHWAVHETADGWWRMWFGEQFLLERPLLPPVYRPNGAIKIGRISRLEETRNFFGEKLIVSEMAEDNSIHVALPMDLAVAEYLLTQRTVQTAAK